MKTKPNGLLNRDEVRAFQVKRAPLYYVELLSYSNKEYLVRKATLADYDWVEPITIRDYLCSPIIGRLGHLLLPYNRDCENMTEKVTKSSVDYRPGGGKERCHNCAMYHTGKLYGSCDLVEGKIAPEYVCDKWVKK